MINKLILDLVKVSDFIKDLLFTQDTVIIPDMGAFKTIYKPAEINNKTNSVSPPSKTIGFDSRILKSDGLLVNHIAETLKITNSEAKEHVFKFVANTFMKLESGKTIHLEGIGSLMYDKKKKLEFVPENSINYEIDSYGLSSFKFISIGEPVITKALTTETNRATQKTKQVSKTKQSSKTKGKPVTTKQGKDQSGKKEKKSKAPVITLISIVVIVGVIIALAFTTDLLDKPIGYLAELTGINIPEKTTTQVIKPDENKQKYEIDKPQDTTSDNSNESTNLSEENITEESTTDPEVEESQLEETTASEQEEQPVVVENVQPETESSVEEPAQSEVIKPSSTGAKRFYLIVGSYNSVANARVRQNELIKQGNTNAEILQASATKYRVSIASFSAKSQAIQKMKEVRKTLGRDAVWLLAQ